MQGATPQQVLQEQFGFDRFRPGQKEVIDKILARQNTLAVMPTGGGKSLCYQIPALLNSGVTLVVSPLISLMKDQVDALKQNGIAAATINSTISREEVNPILRAAYEGRVKLIYVTPERLNMEYFRYQLNFLNISLVAIDEAHCISQWGHDFRPAYRQLYSAINNLHSQPPTLALTATATPEVQRDIGQQLAIPQQNFVVTDFARPNITFRVVHPRQSPRQYILDYLRHHAGEAGIIYVNTRKRVERLTDFLNGQGIDAAAYHAGMDNQTRSRVQDDFQYDRLPVIVATNAFGMGIDKSNVRFVIHATSAPNLESYYQEAGRAGRDGLPSEATLIYQPSDTQQFRWFIDQSDADEEYRKIQYRKLQTMTEYANTPRCLQQFIVRYFGQDCPPCGHCSNCDDQRPLQDITAVAQAVLAMVADFRGNYGKTMVAKAVTGSKDQQMRQAQADRLPHYGALQQLTRQQASSLVDYLTATGYLQVVGSQYPLLTITPAGQAVLNGEQRVARRQEEVITQRGTTVEETPEAAALFEQLRSTRRRLADKQGVPPFMIFSDRTLHEMARSTPQTPAEFLQINGVGRVKLQQYGETMIKTIQNFLSGTD